MAFGVEKQESSAERVCVFFISDVLYLEHRDTITPSVRSPCSSVYFRHGMHPQGCPVTWWCTEKHSSKMTKHNGKFWLLCCLGLAVFDYFVCLLLLHICWLSHVAVICCHLVFREFFWFVFVFYKLCFSFMFIIVLSSLFLYNVVCGWFFNQPLSFTVCYVPNLCCPERKSCRTTPGQQGALCQWEGCHFPNYRWVNCKKYLLKKILKYTIIWRYRNFQCCFKSE